MARPKGMDGVQLPRVVVPRRIHALLESEKHFSGMSVADIIRDALADRYRDRLFDADAARTDPTVQRAREQIIVKEAEK